MSNFTAIPLLALDPAPGDLVVTLTGILLVFMILVILMLIITLEGKIFDGMAAKKKAAAEASKAAAAVAAAKPAAAPAPTPAEQPAVEAGIPGEIVAVIAAAVAAMSGGKYTLKAVRRAGHGRGTWGKAGASDVTAPF